MKDVITLLIEDDIKITRFVRTLSKIGIDASDYLTNRATVVFKLMEIDFEKHSDEYFQMVEQLADSGNNKTEVFEVYESLKKFKVIT